MKAALNSASEGKPLDSVTSLSGRNKETQRKTVELSTFSLSELVYEVLAEYTAGYLTIRVQESELVVIRSDKELIRKALGAIFGEMLEFAAATGSGSSVGIRILGKKSVGYLAIDCPGLDLTALSLRTGRNAMILTGKVEPAFGFVIADQVLSRVKASFNIYQNRTGGSSLLIEIPKVRGNPS